MQLSTSDLEFGSLELYFRGLSEQPRPALIHYAAGSRVELSGRVLENWIAKSANMLCEEFDVEPGDRIAAALDPHWRSAALGLAAVRCGAEYAPSARTADARVWIGFSSRSGAEEADAVLLVGRGALSTSWDGDGEAPEGSVDYCAEVRTFGDRFEPLSLPEDSTVLGEDGEGNVLDAAGWLALTAEHARRTAREHPGAAAVAETRHAELTLADLARWAGIIGSGRALVLVDPEEAADEAHLARILAEERAELEGA